MLTCCLKVTILPISTNSEVRIPQGFHVSITFAPVLSVYDKDHIHLPCSSATVVNDQLTIIVKWSIQDLPYHYPFNLQGGVYAMKTIDRRQQVMDSAEKSFALFGYKATTMEQVARLANVGKGTIYTFLIIKKNCSARFCAQSLRI